jgi:hypothetical protein
MLGAFQLGALYAASPYQALVASNRTKQEFLELAMRQTHTLYLVAILALVFYLVFFVTLVIRWLQEKKASNQSSHPTLAFGRRG